MFWDLQVSLVGEERAAAESLAEQAIALAAASGASGAPFNAEIRGNSSAWEATAVEKVAGLQFRQRIKYVQYSLWAKTRLREVRPQSLMRKSLNYTSNFLKRNKTFHFFEF